MPILSGEWGYSTFDHGVSLETQAAFLVRQQLSNLANGVPLSIWYDWKNDGTDAAENEHNFGTVYPDLRPKPAYKAMQVMTRELAGCRIARRLDVGDPASYVLLLASPAGAQKLAAWSLTDGRTASVDLGPTSPSAVAIVNAQGQPQPVNLDQTRLQLALSPAPQYITLKTRSPALAAAAAWELAEPLAIEAGVKGGLAVQLTVRNPFPHPVTALAKLFGPSLSAQESRRLPAGGTATVTFAEKVSRRDLPQVPVTLTLEMDDAAGRPIGRCDEPLTFALVNPLRLLAAPAEKGLRVTVQNELAGSFDGFLEVGQEKRAFALTPAQAAATEKFSVRRAGSEWPAVSCRLLEQSGEAAAEAEPRRFELLAAARFVARVDGDNKVPGTASIQKTAAPGEDPPYANAFALDYQFDAGWRFAFCEPAAPVRLGPRPAALGLWVYGDNSGNTLRARLRDAAGQTFQPSGPALNWTGWRWVTFDLEHLDQAGHWGGANDGVVKGNLTIETPLLIDSTRRKFAGRIYFTGLTAVY
jgi:hypothetical protein